MQQRFPKDYRFLPRSYLLPQEEPILLEHCSSRKFSTPFYIVKPKASSQGKGIFVTSHIGDLITNKQIIDAIVSEYILNPLLINGYKFDLRIYTLVSSINPLKIWVYQDGLARFCADKFSLEEDQLKNRFAHLTNYSINKKSKRFKVCQDEAEVGQGSKCLVTHLKQHIGKTHYTLLFRRIEDIIIKTIIAAENTLFKAFQGSVRYRDSCFELLGFDILLDSNYNPWLLEVNTSPSFATDSQLDFDLKKEVLTEAFNIAGFGKDKEEQKVASFKLNTKIQTFLTPAASRILSKQQNVQPKSIAQLKRQCLLNEL